MRAAIVAVLLAAASALGVALVVASSYVLAPSLPLDDAWAIAASGRTLATEGRLVGGGDAPSSPPAFPLWAALSSVPHLIGWSADGAVVAIKLVGFTLHVAAAVVLLLALCTGAGPSPERVLGPLLVAFHPDLVSASLSGIETPLAALLAAGLVWASRRAPAWAYGALALVAPLARPELAPLALVLPLAWMRDDRPRACGLLAAGLAGSAVSFGLMALSRVPLSAPLFPTVVYAPAIGGVLHREAFGFDRVLGQIPVVDSGLLLVAAALAAAWLVGTSRATPSERSAACVMLGGLAVCAASFAFLPAIVPTAFVAQRSALPALPLLVGAMPILLYAGARSLLPPRALLAARVLVPLVLLSSEAVDAPARYWQLANDARNVDETQVAMALALERDHAGRVVWTTGGSGAVRYWSRARVVEVGGSAPATPDRPRPDFVEIVPGRSSIQGPGAHELRALAFRTTTPDTVDGTNHAARERYLVACVDGTSTLELRAGGQALRFPCPGGVGPVAHGQR